MVAPSVVGKPSGEVTVDMGIAGKLPYEAAGRHGDIISLIHPLYSKSEKKGGDSVVRVFASATFPRTRSCRHGRPPTSPTTAMGEAITASVRSPPSATPPPHLILEETTDHLQETWESQQTVAKKNCDRTNTATRFQTPQENSLRRANPDVLGVNHQSQRLPCQSLPGTTGHPFLIQKPSPLSPIFIHIGGKKEKKKRKIKLNIWLSAQWGIFLPFLSGNLTISSYGGPVSSSIRITEGSGTATSLDQSSSP